MSHTAQFDPNNYEFNPESKKGVYIIHGFSSTTYEIKALAEFLGNAGFHVKADNLPGHGTTVEDCNSTKFTDWLAYVEQGVAELASTCDTVFVVGISMGGVLALHLASIFPLNGVVVAATVLEFKKRFMIRVVNKLLHRFIPKLDKSAIYDKADLKNMKFYGYNHYPMIALNEMRKMTNVIRKELPKVKIPIMIIHTMVDKTSVFENVNIIKNNINSTEIQELIVHKANHSLFDTNDDQKHIFDETLNFINSRNE